MVVSKLNTNACITLTMHASASRTTGTRRRREAADDGEDLVVSKEVGSQPDGERDGADAQADDFERAA